MTYVTEQTSAELRAHMRRLQKMPGWHNPLDDRLFAEIVAQDAELDRLRSTQATPDAAEAGKDAIPEGWKLVPVEPTDAMIDATYDGQHCSDIWRDMLDAAPEAPGQEAAAVQAVGAWQDIATAAHSGRDILVYTDDGRTRLAFYDEARGGVWSCWPGREALTPTHWMPLPAAPADSSMGGGER